MYMCASDQINSFEDLFSLFKAITSFKDESRPFDFLIVIACPVGMLFRNEAEVCYKQPDRLILQTCLTCLSLSDPHTAPMTLTE